MAPMSFDPNGTGRMRPGLKGRLYSTVSAIPLNRIAVRTVQMNGLAAEAPPQAMYDLQGVEAIDAEFHPHMGTFTHTAVKDGVWSDPTVWAGGIVPGSAGDTIVDRATVNVNTSRYAVTYDLFMSDAKDANGKIAKALNGIHVGGAGVFRLSTSVETRLYVDTLMVHGTTVFGETGNIVPESATPGKAFAEIVFVPQEAPGITTRLGLMTMGAVRCHGAPKAPRLQAVDTIPAGATTIALDNLAAASWRAGDTILLVSTQHAGISTTDASYKGPTKFWGQNGPRLHLNTELGYMRSQDEVRTIASLSGNTITLDAPTQYAHSRTTATLPRGQTVDIRPVVASLSGSILMRSADASEGGDLTDLQKRAHTMFMHNDDVDCRYVEFRNVARTDTNPTLATDQRDFDATTNLTQYFVLLTDAPASGGTLMRDPLNVRGRYGVHLHGNGPYASRKMAVLLGNRLWAPLDAPPIPGWGMVHHNARASLEGNVIFNVRGAGMVTENGNETGQWLDNVVAYVRGDGFLPDLYSRAEKIQNHNGHAGVAYESQARQILSQGNVASSCHYAWHFMQQATYATLDNPTSMLKRVADRASLIYRNGFTSNGNFTSNIDDDVEYAVANGTYGIEQAQIPFFNDNITFASGTPFLVRHRPQVDRKDNTPLVARGNHAISCRHYFDVPEYSWDYWFYDFLHVGLGMGQAEKDGFSVHFGSNTWEMGFVNGKIKNVPVFAFEDLGGFNYNGAFIDIDTSEAVGRFSNQPIRVFTTDPANHIALGAMGPWQVTVNGNGTWTVQLETWRSRSSLTELPLDLKGGNLPIPPLGPSPVEPIPGKARPYFYLDPASDITVTPTGFSTASLFGVVVDGVGIRRWPDHYSLKEQSSTPATGPWINTGLNGIGLVRTNGCFLDGGTWRCPVDAWAHDRNTGEMLRIRIDLILDGFTGTIDGLPASDFLAKYSRDPNKVLVVPMLPEYTGPQAPLTRITTPPIIVTGNATVAENAPLSLRLQYRSDLHVSWAIDTDTTVPGNEDAARFAVSGVTLTWAGNGTRDFEAPDDADGDRVYNVRLRATDAHGNVAYKALTVTLTDVLEAVTRLTADFTGADGTALSAIPGFSLVAGSECFAIASHAIGTASPQPPVAQPSVYATPDFGVSDLFVEYKPAGSGGVAIAAVRYVDAANFIGIHPDSSNGQRLRLVQRLNSDFLHVLAEYGPVTGNYSGAQLRLEVQGNSVQVFRNGVRLTPVSGSEYLPTTSSRSNRCAIVALNTLNQGFDNFDAGKLTPVNAAPGVASNTIPQTAPWVDQVISTSAVATGYPEPAPSYQWQMDATGNGTFANISGQTARTLTVLAAYLGNRLRCVVTPAGGTADASPPTAAVVARKVVSSGVPFRDTFDDGDGLLGYRNGWVVPDDAQRGAWRVVSGRVSLPQVGATLTVPLRIEGPDIGQADGYVEGILGNSGNHFLMFRYNPSTRTFLGLRRTTGNQAQLFVQPPSGAITVLATAGVAAAGIVIRAEIKGAAARILYDGVEAVTTTVASGVLAYLTGTRTGLINTPTVQAVTGWLDAFEAGRV